MKQSLSGVLLRVKATEDHKYVIKQFLKHFKQAKEAHENDNDVFLKEFFDFYVVDEKEIEE